MSKETLLKPSDFDVDPGLVDYENEGGTKKEIEACNLLLEKWNPELEKEVLDAFIKYYNEEMKLQWGPDDKEESKIYWPDIETHEQLLEAINKAGEPPFEHTANEPPLIYALADYNWEDYGGRTVILSLNCPWDEHGWAAVFINEKFVKVDRDIVDVVWMD